MSKYYEFHLPGAPEETIALPIPARLVETFSKRNIVFAPTPQGEAMSALYFFFRSAIVHFYMQRKLSGAADAAIGEANRFAGQNPNIAAGPAAGFAGALAGANPIDAANPPNVPGAPAGEDRNEDGRETHFTYQGERFPYIAAFWETMHAGNVVKPAGYVLWLVSWAPRGLTRLISSHLKRCATFANDAKAKTICDPRYYALKDPVLMMRAIEDVFCSADERECVSYMDVRAYKDHLKHPCNFFSPERLNVFYPNGWSVSTGNMPGVVNPPLPYFMQFIPYPTLCARECTWDFPIYYLEKDIADILCNDGGALGDTARVGIEGVIEAAIREKTLNTSTSRSPLFFESQSDVLAYVRERYVVLDGASEAERIEMGERVFAELPTMMTLPSLENEYVGNVSKGQFAVFSEMSKIPLPAVRGARTTPTGASGTSGNGTNGNTANGAGAAATDNGPLFPMVTRDLSASGNVLLKIISMFHDAMGVHFGNRMCMTMSCFVNNLGAARPYVGTGLLACIGLFGPKALGKNRAHDAAALLMNPHVIETFSGVTQAIFRTNSNFNGMKLSVLETPKELLGIDQNGQPVSTALAEMFKELLTSGKIRSCNYNGGTEHQNLRTTKFSEFHAAGTFCLICNYRRELIEKTPQGSRIMMLENQNFQGAIDAQSADSFLDEHSGDSIESTLSEGGHRYKDRMRRLFDVFYVYCAFQRMGQIPLLPEEPVRMVLDGMNDQLRKRGYDGYTARVGTQIINEVRALSTFLAIALWWEGGLGAAYRTANNVAFLSFRVLWEIARHVRVSEDAMVFVFSQNISLVQSPLRQTVTEELRRMFVGGAPKTWNEQLVSAKTAPNPLTHGEESVQDQWLRENYLQLNISIAELRRMLSDKLKIAGEEIATAMSQIKDRERIMINGMARNVFVTRGPYTDQRGYFLKEWVAPAAKSKKSKSGVEQVSGNIYGEFAEMLYACMSLDKTVPTACITMFPSDVDGTAVGISRVVQVLSVPARVVLETRPNTYKVFSRPAHSFYFKDSTGNSARYRVTDGEWQQRGFPAVIAAEQRIIIDHALLEARGIAFNGGSGISLDYPRGGIESVLRDHKEQVLGEELRKNLPRVMPCYSKHCDLWMPDAREENALEGFTVRASVAGGRSSTAGTQNTAGAGVTAGGAESGDNVSINDVVMRDDDVRDLADPEERQRRKEEIEEERKRKEEEKKKCLSVMRRYQTVRTQHQSAMYGVYAYAMSCRRWCECVCEAKFDAAAVVETYIEALADECDFARAGVSFAALSEVQCELYGLLAGEAFARFTGTSSQPSGATSLTAPPGFLMRDATGTAGFTCLLETLPVLNADERAFCRLYVEFAALRPIARQAAFVRPSYIADETVVDNSVASVTATFESFCAAMKKMRKPSKRVRTACAFTRRQILNGVAQACIKEDPGKVRKILENVTCARREVFACLACGDVLTACAVETEMEAALALVRRAVAEMDESGRAIVRAEAASLPAGCAMIDAAWGNGLFQAILPLGVHYKMLRVDEETWKVQDVVKQGMNPQGGTVARVADVNNLMGLVGVVLTQSNTRALGTLQTTSEITTKRARIGEEQHVHSGPNHEMERGEEEEDDEVGMLVDCTPARCTSIDSTTGGCISVDKAKADAGWMSAYLANATLAVAGTPAVSLTFQRALLESGDKSSGSGGRKETFGLGCIITPGSLSSILFSNE